MRRLTFRKARRERGATAVFVAIALTTLIAGAGLGVDTTSLRYQRSKVQHSADASALAIAYDCAANDGCDQAQATANGLTNENSSGATAVIAPSPVTQADGTVLVTVSKTVDTHLMSVVGIDSKVVTGKARATWTGHPTGGPVLPFAISMCQYLNADIGVETLLRTDINNAIKDTIVKKNNTPEDEAYANMDPYLAPNAPCDVPADVQAEVSGIPSTVSMLAGGLWLSDDGNSVSNGKLLDTTILQQLTSVTGYVQTGWKFADYLGDGGVILLAIYAPTTNYDHAGLHVEDGEASFPGYYDMRIVGYAPFQVSGWCFAKPSGGVTDCGGNAPSSPAIAGKFVKAFSKDPDFDYGDGGTDFGAYDVTLTE